MIINIDPVQEREYAVVFLALYAGESVVPSPVVSAPAFAVRYSEESEALYPVVVQSAVFPALYAEVVAVPYVAEYRDLNESELLYGHPEV